MPHWVSSSLSGVVPTNRGMRREIPTVVVALVLAVVLAIGGLILFNITRHEKSPQEIACLSRAGTHWNGSYCVDPSRGLLVGA